MTDTHPRLPAVNRDRPTGYDVEVELTVRVWDGRHGEYHRFEFVATRQRGDGHVSPQEDTVRAVGGAAAEAVDGATVFLARAYPRRAPR